MKSNFISLIFGIILVGVGCVVTVFEFMDYSFIDVEHNNEEIMVHKNKTISLSEYTSCIDIESHDDYDISLTYDIKYDEQIGNDIIINYGYIEEFYDINIYSSSNDECANITIRSDRKSWKNIVKKIANQFVKDLKNKKIHKYDNFDDLKLEIIVNPKYMGRIDID